MEDEALKSRNINGKIQTVLGLIEPCDLGVTLCHEHIFINSQGLFIEPSNPADRAKSDVPVTRDLGLEHLGWINYNCFSNKDNLVLKEEDVARAEVDLYKRSGGDTIVEVTPIGMGRDPAGLARVSMATGVHIVMGTAYYVNSLHPKDVQTMSEDEVCSIFVREINTGVIENRGAAGIGNNGVRPGIIGEIGCTWPWKPNEKKVLRAAARAQRRTGAPLSIHPGRSERSVLEVIDLLKSAGADLGQTIICHTERTIFNFGTRKVVADAGCYLEFDQFMMDSNYPLSDIDLPNDYERIRQIAKLIHHGYVNQILLSHDMFNKTRLVTYGGLGYGHILNNIIPKMQRKGISESQIHSMLVENPRRVLTFTTPEQ